MSEPKFAKGPWGMDREGVRGWCVGCAQAEETSEDPFWTARLGTFSLKEEDNDRLTHTAHLIAAAPDLYAALQECLDHGSMTGHEYVTDKALAALAKARGEA